MWPAFGAAAPLVIALLLDGLVGDPPNRFHPVAWMGTVIGWVRQVAPQRGRVLPFLSGVVLLLVGGAVVIGVGLWLQGLVRQLPSPWHWVGEAIILKTTFSIRGLMRAANQVRQALEAKDLAQARHLVGWHLVSRDTTQLGPPEVAAATIESVSENASDGIMAPLFFYAVGGLPGALVYRFINTADSMLGYHDSELEWLGKAPARIDDVMNLIPARLTAVLIIVAAMFLRGDPVMAWKIWRGEARFTESPNAGHPMSSMAGALHVELEKFGYYRLGAGHRFPDVADISIAVRLIYGATALGAVSLMGLMVLLAL